MRTTGIGGPSGMDLDFWWAAIFNGIRHLNLIGHRTSTVDEKRDLMGMYLMGGEL